MHELHCPECTIDEDPRPWCECEHGELCAGPCRQRAHDPVRCPKRLANEATIKPSDPDMVAHPPHYESHPSGVQPITITRHETFCLGNVIKYCMRAKYKGNEIQDLRKAAQYLTWEIERLESKS